MHLQEGTTRNAETCSYFRVTVTSCTVERTLKGDSLPENFNSVFVHSPSSSVYSPLSHMYDHVYFVRILNMKAFLFTDTDKKPCSSQENRMYCRHRHSKHTHGRVSSSDPFFCPQCEDYMNKI